VEWQIRGVIQMIEDEANVQNIVQQLSAVKSAMTQAVNEEIFCAIEKLQQKDHSNRNRTWRNKSSHEK